MAKREPPRKKILSAYGSIICRNRRGIIQWAALECGHVEKTNAAERKQGWVTCFDCYYGKPPFLSPEELDAFKCPGDLALRHQEACDGAQIAWETAMGMRGYAGSSAEKEDRIARAIAEEDERNDRAAHGQFGVGA